MIRIRKAKIIVKSLLIMAIFGLFSVILYQNWYVFTQNDWTPKEYMSQPIFTAETPQNREKCELKAMVEDVFQTPHIYVEYNETFDVSTIGRAIPQLRIAFVDKDLVGVEYAWTLSHELSHIKYQSVNECYTEFMAIKTLVESKYEYTQNLGKYIANLVAQGCYGGNEYDCGWYLVEYFKGE